MIYIAQDDVTLKAGVTSAYRFYIPELPEEVLQHGIILELFVNEQIASWDPKDRILCCSRGLGASIYIGLRGGPGKILLVGIDSRLSARCNFDNAPDSWYYDFDMLPQNRLQLAQILLKYRSHVPSSRGVNQILLQKLLADVEPRFRVVKDTIMTIRENIRKDGPPDWDQWASRCSVTSALLELGIWTSSETTTSFRSKIEKVTTKVSLRISTKLEEEVIKGQRLFLVRFPIQDWKREVAVRNESELQQVFHDIHHVANPIPS